MTPHRMGQALARLGQQACDLLGQARSRWDKLVGQWDKPPFLSNRSESHDHPNRTRPPLTRTEPASAPSDLLGHRKTQPRVLVPLSQHLGPPNDHAPDQRKRILSHGFRGNLVPRQMIMPLTCTNRLVPLSHLLRRCVYNTHTYTEAVGRTPTTGQKR